MRTTTEIARYRLRGEVLLHKLQLQHELSGVPLDIYGRKKFRGPVIRTPTLSHINSPQRWTRARPNKCPIIHQVSQRIQERFQITRKFSLPDLNHTSDTFLYPGAKIYPKARIFKQIPQNPSPAHDVCSITYDCMRKIDVQSFMSRITHDRTDNVTSITHAMSTVSTTSTP